MMLAAYFSRANFDNTERAVDEAPFEVAESMQSGSVFTACDWRSYVVIVDHKVNIMLTSCFSQLVTYGYPMPNPTSTTKLNLLPW